MKAEKKEASITRIHSPYIKNKTLADIREYKRKRKLKMRMQLIVAIGIFFVLLSGSTLIKNYSQVSVLEQERAEAEETLHSLDLHQDELEYYITLLEDEEYVAKLARSEYYLTKDNEIVFSFPDDKRPDHLGVINGEQSGANEDSEAEENGDVE